MKPLVSLAMIMFLMACESPRNERVRKESHEGKLTPADLGSGENLNLKTITIDEQQLTLEFFWLKGPVGHIEQNNELLLIVRNRLGEQTSLPDGYSFEFYSHMPSMGHPLENAGQFENLFGSYINKTIRYNMPGDWTNEILIFDESFNLIDQVVWNDFF